MTGLRRNGTATARSKSCRPGRSNRVRRGVWAVLIVMATLLPWRVALACAHDAASMQQRCCCTDAMAPCPQVSSGVGKCCKHVVALQGQVKDAEADALPPFSGDKTPAPPPLSHLAPDWIGHPPPLTALGTSPPGLAGTRTYLVTARLRL